MHMDIKIIITLIYTIAKIWMSCLFLSIKINTNEDNMDVRGKFLTFGQIPSTIPQVQWKFYQ